MHFTQTGRCDGAKLVLWGLPDDAERKEQRLVESLTQ